MQSFGNYNTLSFVKYLPLVSYGIELKGKDEFKSPLAFDAFDSWLGEDFDYFIENLIDGFFEEIESDLLTVWSTNLSEQESQQASAQLSADREAAGEDTDLNTDATPASLSVSEDTSDSSDSELDSSTSLDHSHGEFGYHGDHEESVYSHT